MESTTSTPPPPPPPASPSVQPPRPPLRRLTDGRWVAGIGAGVARHLGIDPVIVRIAMVALTLFWGAGIALYGLAWLLIPAAGEDRSLAQQWTRDVDGRWRTAGYGAVLLGGVLLAGAIGSGEVVVPLLLLGAGGWLLVRSDEASTGESPTSGNSTAPTPGLVTGDPTTPVAETAESTSLGVPLVSREATTGAVGEAPSEPKPSSLITPLVLALVLLIGGVGLLAARLDLVAVSATGVLATSLAVVGLGLLVSVRWGRARGLIPLGLVLAAGVGIASLFDFPLWSGVGERVVVADTVSDLDDPIRHGFGTMEIDLTELDLDGGTETVEAGVSMGELVLVVPADVDVEVAGEVSAGEIRLFDRHGFPASGNPFDDPDDVQAVDGVDRTIEATRDGDDPSNGTIEIEAQVGFGQLRVEVGE